MFPATIGYRKAVTNVQMAATKAAYRGGAAAAAAAPTKAKASTTAVRFAAGPSNNPADNFARRKAARNNVQTLPAIISADSLECRPQPTHTAASLGFTHLTVGRPPSIAAATQFWHAWLTCPTLESLTVYVTPTCNGFHTLTESTIILIQSFWMALYEAVAAGCNLKKLHIEISSVMFIDEVQQRVVSVLPPTSARLEYANYGGASANPSLTGSFLFSVIGCDSIGYKYRLNTSICLPTLTDVRLPTCFLRLTPAFDSMLAQEQVAEAQAAARTLRVLFPAALIDAEMLSPYVPLTVDAAVEAERAACAVNLRDMTLGRIRRVWADTLRLLEG